MAKLKERQVEECSIDAGEGNYLEKGRENLQKMPAQSMKPSYVKRKHQSAISHTDVSERELRIVLVRCNTLQTSERNSTRKKRDRSSRTVSRPMTKTIETKDPKHEHVDIEDETVWEDNVLETRKQQQPEVDAEIKDSCDVRFMPTTFDRVSTMSHISQEVYLSEDENDSTQDDVVDLNDRPTSLRDEPPTIEYEAFAEDLMKDHKCEMMEVKLRDLESESSHSSENRAVSPEVYIDVVGSDQEDKQTDSIECREMKGSPKDFFSVEFEARTQESIDFRKVEPRKKEYEDSRSNSFCSERSDTLEVQDVIPTLDIDDAGEQYLPLIDVSQSCHTIPQTNSKNGCKNGGPTRKSSRENLYSDLTCDSAYSNQKVMKSHVKTHGVTEFFVCDICNMSFMRKDRLTKHIELHSKTSRPLHCDICNKSFPDKQQIITHLQKHTSGKPFSCKFCDAKFKREDTLRRHTFVHDSTKALSCDVCDKKFPNKSTLTHHARTHSNERPFKCDTCGKKFKENGVLRAHVRVHEDVKPFECEICNKTFRTKGNLKAHSISHSGNWPFPCKVCDKGFIQKGTLALHTRTHTGEKPFSCEICDRKFSDKSTLRKHSTTHTGEKPHVCEICGIKFRQKISLANHKTVHDGSKKQYPCEVCDKTFSARQHMLTHMKRMHRAKRHLCNFCDQKFEYACLLKDHLKRHTGETPYSCEICDKSFPQKKGLFVHMKVHQRNSLLPCSVCSKEFVSQKNLDEHMGLHAAEKPFLCDHCSKGFITKYSLRVHMLTHEGNEPYRCDLCDRGCVSKNILEAHLRIHTGEKPFECKDCGKKFNQRGALTIHMARHNKSNEEAHPCEICGKRIGSKYYLKQHMMIHTGERPFECDDCGMTFRLKNSLSSHVQLIHMDDRPFICKICGIGFGRKSNLRQHMVIHKKDEPIIKCDICGQIVSSKKSLKRHMDTHERYKSTSCKVCGRFFPDEQRLTQHMRLHTSKVFSCVTCDMKFINKLLLMKHKRSKAHKRVASKISSS